MKIKQLLLFGLPLFLLLLVSTSGSAHAQLPCSWVLVNCGSCTFAGNRPCTAVCTAGDCSAPMGQVCSPTWAELDWSGCSGGSAATPTPGGAAGGGLARRSGNNQSLATNSNPSQIRPLPTTVPCNNVDNPLLWPSCALREFPILGGSIVNIGVIIAGFVAVFFVLLGGYQYVTAESNPEKLRRAKNTIIWSTVGLVGAATTFVLFRLLADAFQLSLF